MIIDPIQHVERVVREIHDKSGEYARPILSRYPLTFSFLIVFSFAAILHGFELVSDQIEIFHTHPTLLIGIGIVVLLFTGMLYKSLERKGE
jgi:hypothetical protein